MTRQTEEKQTEKERKREGGGNKLIEAQKEKNKYR